MMRSFKKKVMTVVAVALVIYYYGILPNNKDNANNKYAVQTGVIISQRGNHLPTNVIVNMNSHYLFTRISLKTVNKMFPQKKNLFSLGLHNYVNVYIWQEICGIDIKNLILYPLYPHLPTIRRITKNIIFDDLAPSTGLRVFGYISVKIPGVYKFLLKASYANVKVYLSFDLPENSILICEKNEFISYKNMLSDGMELKSRNYFFEILAKSGNKLGKFSLFWSLVDVNDYQIIGGQNLIFFHNESALQEEFVLKYQLPQSSPAFDSKIYFNNLYDNEGVKKSNVINLPFVPEKDVNGLFPVCAYSPSYLIKRKHGTWLLHYSAIYPFDNTNTLYRLHTNDDKKIHGNDVIDEKVVNDVVNKVMTAIKKIHGSKYLLSSVVNIEENKDLEKGSRFLVELELVNTQGQGKFRLSRYVYQQKSSNLLCYPQNFQWNKTADVNVILTLGNQGRWVQHFIDTMARIYNDTKDPFLNVIIVDFNSQDIDIENALKYSGIPRYTLIKLSGTFHKTLAIQVAVNSILHSNAIVLQVDLHLTIPSNFIDFVRKHTVQGKMLCSPVLLRLQCGATPQTPYGFWESFGYGIFSAYKSDWTRFGGMSVKKHKHKWGGEDWELLQTMLEAGYEVERLKVKNLNHIFHTKIKY